MLYGLSSHNSALAQDTEWDGQICKKKKKKDYHIINFKRIVVFEKQRLLFKNSMILRNNYYFQVDYHILVVIM